MTLQLSAKHLNVHLSGRHILKDVSLPVLSEGELIGVIGPNAAGKSTFLKSIAGLLKYGGSAAILAGESAQEIADLSSRERLRQIAYLPQQIPQASSLSVYELLLASLQISGLAKGKERDSRTISQVLLQLDLGKYAMRPLSELSGGKRQLVAFAMVLLKKPKILLLDEPTSALDLRWQMEVLDMTRQYIRDNQALALIAIHDLNLALRHCDRLIVLAGGEVAAACASENLNSKDISRVYGVDARIEQCSNGEPIILLNSAAVSGLNADPDLINTLEK